jgi:hypothetical protein
MWTVKPDILKGWIPFCVEQQGRLTLHLHMWLWIKGALTPQEICDQIMDPKTDFQKKMVEYLESVDMGEFITGSLEDVK